MERMKGANSMPNTSKPIKKKDEDYRKQIDDIYHKLEIKQNPESHQIDIIHKSESPFNSNSYYLFK